MKICEKCGTPQEFEIEGRVRACLCECQVEEQRKADEQARLEEHRMRIYNSKQNSLLSKRYFDVTFENSVIDAENKEVYDALRAYTINYKAHRESGQGIYIHGKNGTGKTHATACMCNELIEKMQGCQFTNFINIANELKSSFETGDTERVIYKISNVNFLFIDDFGKESFAKLKDDKNGKWLEERIYEIINNRYNAMLPTIFSSNYSFKEMAEKFGIDRAILERIFETCKVLELKGKNRRL